MPPVTFAKDPHGLMPILQKCFTKSPRKHKSIRTIAELLGCSFQAVYQWIESGRLTPARAQLLVKASKGNVTEDELKPFVSRYLESIGIPPAAG